MRTWRHPEARKQLCDALVRVLDLESLVGAHIKQPALDEKTAECAEHHVFMRFHLLRSLVTMVRLRGLRAYDFVFKRPLARGEVVENDEEALLARRQPSRAAKLAMLTRTFIISFLVAARRTYSSDRPLAIPWLVEGDGDDVVRTRQELADVLGNTRFD